MLPLKGYLESKTNIFEKRWINIHIPTPWQIARWGLHQVGIGGSRLSRGDLVILSNIEVCSRMEFRNSRNLIHRQAATQAVLAKLSSLPATATGRIWSLETFTKDFDHVLSADRPLTSSDIQILLTYLTRDKNVAAMQSSSESDLVTIKLGSSSVKATPPLITAQDSTIANLQTLSMRLSDQIALLNDSIAASEATARTAISTSPPQKSRALSALRAKKIASATLEKRQASHEQVTQVLFSIDDAATQVDMVRAMEASTGVLRVLNKQVGGVDKVDGVMEGLREQMADVEDVSKVLGEIGAEGGRVDEAALDEEMEAMLRENREKEEAERVREEDRQKAALLESAPKPPELALSEHTEKETETRLSVSGVEDDLDERLRLLSLSGSG